MTRYVIVGAGAIGATLGGRLAQADRDVVLVARGEHAAAMAERGLTLRDPAATVTVHPPVATAPEDVDLTVDDVVVLTVKTHQVLAAVTAWADRPVRDGGAVVGTAGELLPFVTAQNGVSSEELCLRYVDRVFAACLWMPVVLLEPGEVWVRSSPLSGVYQVGRVPAARTDPRDAAFLDRLVADCAAAAVEIQRPAEVLAWKYRKLLANLGNGVQALLGDGDPEVKRFVGLARDEALAVLAAADIEPVDPDEQRAGVGGKTDPKPIPGQPAGMGGSSWQSLARGTGSIETDYLNGEIVRLAHVHGVPAPVNTVLARLCRQAAARRDAPGSVTADQLDAALAHPRTA
ncbi:NAD(P)-binding domain-containing protein [Nakamurella flavida]|uniref:NAD(P)-binding domain-containing protein n=1 Tax=Nakamurella flavida TaxID=363630 RepID=A0A939C3Z4_9ACTN|nr:2-dehydropantoate 2-reductase N-terminal domain-containing protein [Nakamurella flavida]MBM9478200.1 NAD(P)-binding domain-containing protein [Nakamurella flavida]MDP9778578.1 2-dehydropantoate 2-reductase [Nakamurella flavida]